MSTNTNTKSKSFGDALSCRVAGHSKLYFPRNILFTNVGDLKLNSNSSNAFPEKYFVPYKLILN